MTAPNEGVPSYAVRFAAPVSDLIVQEYERLADIADNGVAEQWRRGLLEVLRSLATYPYRCPTAPETTIFQRVAPSQTLRQLVYRRTRSGPAWRILFTIVLILISQSDVVCHDPTRLTNAFVRLIM